jgi:hypothetical protein
MSDPIMSRLLELEKRHNHIIDTVTKIFDNQQDQINALHEADKATRELLIKIHAFMTADNQETTK